QDPTGTIEGLITDNTAAAVADARVTVKNLDTGVTRTVRPGGDGFYRLMALPAGKYSLAVEAPKFARFAQQPIEVNVSDAVRVDVHLSLAAISEAITVEGRANLVESS